MFPKDWRCFVINLARSPRRLKRISDHLETLGIPFSRYEAFDEYEVSLEESCYFSRRAYMRRHGKLPVVGEVGCFMSHLGVLQTFLDSDASCCLVLEDDAVLAPQTAQLLDGLECVPDKWDMVLLYGNHSGTPMKLASLDDGHHLVGYFTRQTGAVAYAVNRRAAEAYVSRLLPMSLPFDQVFDNAWTLGIKFRGVAPSPVSTGEHHSDIGQTGRKFAWYRRLPTYADRTVNEIRRFWHYTAREPIWLEAWHYRRSLGPRRQRPIFGIRRSREA